MIRRIMVQVETSVTSGMKKIGEQVASCTSVKKYLDTTYFLPVTYAITGSAVDSVAAAVSPGKPIICRTTRKTRDSRDTGCLNRVSPVVNLGDEKGMVPALQCREGAGSSVGGFYRDPETAARREDYLPNTDIDRYQQKIKSGSFQMR